MLAIEAGFCSRVVEASSSRSIRYRPKAVEVETGSESVASDHIHLRGTSIRYRAFRIGGAVNRG